MHGIAGGLSIEGSGTVAFQVLDDYGRIQHLQGTGLLIKDLPTRLIPPQVAMLTDSDGSYRINGSGGQFHFAHNGGIVSTPLDLRTNLPTVVAFRDAHSAASSLHRSL